MQVVDAQVHTWDAVMNNSFAPHRKEPFGIPDLLVEMADAHVDKVVLIPPSWSAEGTPQIVASLDNYPDKFRVIGRVSLESGIVPDPDEIESWARLPKVVGLRLVLYTDETVARFNSGACDWVWEVASRHDLPIMIYTPGRQELLGQIVSSHPELRFAADHLSLPFETADLDKTTFASEIVKLCDLASLPNLAVKASTLPIYSQLNYPFRDLHEPLYQVIDAFGAHRVFWGSDLSRLKCAYRDAVRMISEGMTDLTEPARSLVLGEALLDWLGWR